MKTIPRLEPEQIEAIARLFGMLAEPTRLAILQELRDAPRSVNELVDAMQAKQANVSKQLGLLYGAGLVDRKRDGSQVIYSLRETMTFELCTLVWNKLRRDAEEQAKLFRKL